MTHHTPLPRRAARLRQSWRLGFLAVSAAVVAAPGCLSAQDHTTPLHRLGMQNWSSAEGLPHSSPMSIVQSRAGYLWFTNDSGLTRFDGRRFTRFDQRARPPLRGGRPTAIVATDAGSVVIANSLGVFRNRDEGGNTGWEPLPSWSPATVVALLATTNDEVWAGNTRGGVAKWSEGGWMVGLADGEPEDRVTHLAFDANGTLWAATSGAGVRRIEPGRPTITIAHELAETGATALAFEPDGSVWIGTYGAGLQRWSNQVLTRFAADRWPADAAVDSLLRDKAQ